MDKEERSKMVEYVMGVRAILREPDDAKARAEAEKLVERIAADEGHE